MIRATYKVEHEINIVTSRLSRDKDELKRLKIELKEAKKRDKKSNIIFHRDICQTIIHENSTVFVDDGTTKVEPKTITTKFNTCASNLAFHTLHQEWHDNIIVSDEFKDDEIKNTMT